MATLDELDTRVTSVEAAIKLLTSVAERQQTMLEETRREANYTRRLWILACRKLDLLDDETWQRNELASCTTGQAELWPPPEGHPAIPTPPRTSSRHWLNAIRGLLVPRRA